VPRSLDPARRRGSPHNGPGGETELSANVDIRLASTLNDRDNTGDYLNLIAMLLLSI